MTEFGLWVYNGGWWILLTVGVLLAMAAVMTGLVFNTKGLSDELSGRTRRREIERLKRKYAGMRDEDIEGRMRELVEPLETASDGPVAASSPVYAGAASAPVYGPVTPSYGAAAPAAAPVDAGRGSVVAELKASIYGYDEEDEEEKTGVFTPETPEDTAAGRVQFDAQGVELPQRAEEAVVQSAQFDAQGVELPQRAEEAQQAEGLQRSEVEDQPAKRLEGLAAELPQKPSPGIPPILPVTLEHEEEEQTSADLTAVEDTEAETSVDLSSVEEAEAETSVDLTEDPTALQTQEELDEYPTEEFKKTSGLPRVYLLDMPTSASAIRLNTAGLGILAEAYSTGSYDPVTGETRKRDTAEGETGTSFVSQL